MIVLGIDPGTRKTGLGLVQPQGRSYAARGYGTIRLDPDAPLVERLGVLHRELASLLEQHHPDAAVVEGIFYSGAAGNYQSTLKLGHARGVVLLAVAQSRVPLAEYPPAEVKKALTGHGRAEKAQVRGMICALLRLATPPAEDASDALALALCHCFRTEHALTWREP